MSARLVLLDRLGPWAPAWDALVADLDLPSPFLRSWWIDHAATATPEIRLVVDGGDLLGGLALQRDRIGGIVRYRELGAGALCPDQLDVVCTPESRSVVLEVLAADLAGRRAIVDLDGLVPDPLLRRIWPAARVEESEGNRWQPLSQDQPYLETRSKNYRRKIRKLDRRLDELGVVHRTVDAADPVDVSAALETLRALHAQRPERARFVEVVPRLEPILQAGARAGEVRFDLYEHDGEPIVVMLTFDVAGRLGFYQFARSLDPAYDAASLSLHVRVIDEIARAGYPMADFLRGSEDYKTYLADEIRPVMRLRHGQGSAARGYWGARRTAGRAVRRLRRADPA